MVFFFDEAHMLFSQASPDLLNKIEQIVKLIRSKGVGVFFITQNPADIPDGIMSQLGNKIQHALHAYSPKELKAVKAAAQTYRENPEFDTADAIQHLATGQALVSMLDESGIPGIVERCMILPPQSLLGTADDSLRDQMIKSNVLYSRYATAIDRDSAFEFLQRHWQEMEAQALRAAEEAQAEKERAAAEKEAAKEAAAAQKLAEKEAAAAQKAAEQAQREAEREQERAKKRAASVASTAAGTIGRQIGKSVGSLGGTFGKTLGGNIGAQLGRSILGTFLKL
jgi:DNA helicase HerA-like ATPase